MTGERGVPGLANQAERTRRLARLDEPHVVELNRWVRDLQSRLPAGDTVPWFDPNDGGFRAEILWLLEAPSRRATSSHGGSGFISCDNNDQTAKNTFNTRVEARVDRRVVVHWNAIPFYIGNARSIRRWTAEDLSITGPLLDELAELLPNIKAVIPAGGAAQTAWDRFAPRRWSGVHVCRDVPHPSPTNLNTRPGNRERVVAAWREARAVTSAM